MALTDTAIRLVKHSGARAGDKLSDGGGMYLLVSPDGSQTASFTKSLAAGATWPFPEVVGHTLADGGKLVMISTAANAVRVRASGRQFT